MHIIKKLFNNGQHNGKPNGWFGFEYIDNKLHIYSSFKNKKISASLGTDKINL